jgi:hypothetical protein
VCAKSDVPLGSVFDPDRTSTRQVLAAGLAA